MTDEPTDELAARRTEVAIEAHRQQATAAATAAAKLVLERCPGCDVIVMVVGTEVSGANPIAIGIAPTDAATVTRAPAVLLQTAAALMKGGPTVG